MSQIETKIFEKYIVDRMVECFGIEANFHRLGKAGSEADIIIELSDGSMQGVEVVTAYKDERHAKAYWEKIMGDGDAITEYIAFLHNLNINHREKMKTKLQSEIDRKCQKSLVGKYGQRAWLCVFENSPITSHRDIEKICKEILIPKSNFSKVIILNESRITKKFLAFNLYTSQ
jgi:hypothetical protein